VSPSSPLSASDSTSRSESPLSSAAGASPPKSDEARANPIQSPRNPDGAAPIPREKFIPLRKADLKLLVLDAPWVSAEDRPLIAQIAASLDAVIHAQMLDDIERIKDVYTPFDPDGDTSLKRGLDPKARSAESVKFFGQLAQLVTKANYQRLPLTELMSALDRGTPWSFNLEVDFQIFERLEIYARGEKMIKRKARSVWPPFRETTLEIPSYQRLILAFKLRENKKNLAPQVDVNTIHLKIFKNIPKADLEMLLPGTQIRMSWLDQGKIILPTLSGVALLLWKLITGILFVAFAGIAGLLTLLGLASAGIGYGVRSFYGYINMRDKYHLNLTRNLYYQNLDSNAGVFFRLLDEAQEQDFREAFIGYLVLREHGGEGGLSVDEIDAKAEEFIQQQTQSQVDFEIGDAVNKLSDWGLARAMPEGKWMAIAPADAIDVLRDRWARLSPVAEDSEIEPQRPVFLLRDDDLENEDEWDIVM
jgi:hypothetical protein